MTGLFRLFLGLFLCSLACPSVADTAPHVNGPSSDQADPFALVEQLGHPSFRVRDRASAELIALGRDAKAALLAGQDNENAEVRFRCQRLLPLALEADLHARIQEFLADEEGMGDHQLPGWDRFRGLLGEGKEIRKMYARMLKAHETLLETDGDDGERLSEKYRDRITELQQIFNMNPNRRGQPQLMTEEVATLLFVGCDSRLERSDPAHSMLGSLFYQPVFRATMTAGGNDGEFLRTLFFTWMKERANTSAMYQAFYLILNADMKEALPIALEMMNNKDLYSHSRGMAILAVGKFGGKKHIPELEKMLDDENVLTTVQINNIKGQVQTRDVALAMCIHLTGQKLEDYHFDMMQNRSFNFTYYYHLGFSDEKNREKSLKKWKEWREKNPRPQQD